MSQLCNIRHDFPVTLQVYIVNGQRLTTNVISSRRSSGQDLGLGGFRMANSESGDHEIEIYAMYSYIPPDLNQLLDTGADRWLQICIVYACQWAYVMVKGLLC